LTELGVLRRTILPLLGIEKSLKFLIKRDYLHPVVLSSKIITFIPFTRKEKSDLKE